MREGSLEAPTRHAIDWQSEEFYDEAKIEAELHRVFDICHGCRRCFNLCDSFPRLFDMVDESPSGELDTVDTAAFKQVIDACTLCDMCFMTKCPYVPPHSFELDFPHLMLRAKAAEFRRGERGAVDKALAETDALGKVGGLVAGIANWGSSTGNALTRPLISATLGIDPRAELPKFSGVNVKAYASAAPVNPQGTAVGRKAAIYATCYGAHNDPKPIEAVLKVLAHNGVDTTIAYPGCCGMPKLENGDLAGVAQQAATVAEALGAWLDQGYDIVAGTPSCALMLKFEWPLLLPDNAAVKRLSAATFDISEYVVDIARRHGMTAGLQPLDGGVAMHLACHARAQNMGPKAAEMLRLIPDTPVTVVERCSGHGGKWGFFKGNFDIAMKVGKPAATAAAKAPAAHIASECPLAGPHLAQIIAENDPAKVPARVGHPIELVARAYGL